MTKEARLEADRNGSENTAEIFKPTMTCAAKSLLRTIVLLPGDLNRALCYLA